MAEGILYTVKPQPDGRKIRIASDAKTGQMLDAQALPEKRLRYKAIKRRRKS